MRRQAYNLIQALLLISSIGGICVTQAELLVIVHPSNTMSINEKQISRLFLGKLRAFPSGVEALPIDQPRDSEMRVAFGNKVLRKSPHQLRSYWSKIIFSGKGFPPEVLDNMQEVKELVASSPYAIGYIDSSALDNTVKVLKTY